MESIESLLLWIGAHLTGERFLLLTKIQAITWSIADIFLVYYFLKIADLARQYQRQSPLRAHYYVLGASAVLTPLLLFVSQNRQLFLLESLICGLQFCLLVVTAISERSRLMALFKTALTANTIPR